MFGSHVLHGLPSGESDDKHQQVQADKALAHSLASMPAGLEVVPRHHTHFQQAEKEIVQELPEAISQDGKEVLGILAPPHKILAPSETRQAERRRCGLKPRYFYATMASLVVVLALIVGLGSGLGTRRSRVSSNCDPCMHPQWETVGISDTQQLSWTHRTRSSACWKVVYRVPSRTKKMLANVSQLP